LETVGANAKSIELIDAHDLVKLGFREGGAFEKHDHGDEAGHDDHAHSAETEHDHDHDKTAEVDHDHDHDKAAEAGHDGHDHGEFDAHVWLDPENAKAMVHEIEEALAEADPDNAATYEANAAAVTARLDALIADVSSELEPVRGKGFIVFHDGYQYFENRFGITASGSITVSPEVMPGAERITEIRERVQELGAACVFAEPQFEPKLVSTVIEGTNARSGTLDPLGAELEDGVELYFQLIRNMSTSIKTCLTEAS
jgi:zinc transport system substrate-binding protein